METRTVVIIILLVMAGMAQWAISNNDKIKAWWEVGKK
jgi:hypothetical protein